MHFSIHGNFHRLMQIHASYRITWNTLIASIRTPSNIVACFAVVSVNNLAIHTQKKTTIVCYWTQTTTTVAALGLLLSSAWLCHTRNHCHAHLPHIIIIILPILLIHFTCRRSRMSILFQQHRKVSIYLAGYHNSTQTNQIPHRDWRFACSTEPETKRAQGQ